MLEKSPPLFQEKENWKEEERGHKAEKICYRTEYKRIRYHFALKVLKVFSSSSSIIFFGEGGK